MLQEIDKSENIESIKYRTIQKLERSFGSELIDVLKDPKTVEIMLNPDGLLWLERLGEPMTVIGSMEPNRAISIINTVSSFHHKVTTSKEPLLEAELPLDGSRFAAMLPPVVSSPVFSIRKQASQVFTLDSYVDDEIMSSTQANLIKQAVKDQKNILIVGGTGSGKTTLTNAIIQEITIVDPNRRLFVIEDTGEIQCSAKNYVQPHTLLNVSLTDLIRITMRFNPGRIIVGEVRGPEAWDLLNAWNSGHPGGISTLHANNTESALTKLRSYVSANPNSPRDIEPVIAEALDMIVFINQVEYGRKVKEMLLVKGYENGKYVTERI